MTLELSVVIATYERPKLLVRLLEDLAKQTLAPSRFEVIAIDDGSKDDPAPHVRGLSLPYAFTLHRQPNQGPAVARHKGVELAKGEVVVFLDDDMHAPPQLLEEHLRPHQGDPNVAVLGRIREDEGTRLELHERFHARLLEKFLDDVRDGRIQLVGTNVYTGNFSVRRERYLKVGGFDATLKRSEDAELGVRLQKDGVRFAFADAAYTIHTSDHASLEGWLGRAYRYGIFDSKIGKKHPDLPETSPWRYFRQLSRIARPALWAAVAAPAVTKPASRATMRVMLALDKVGLERVALAGTKLAYAIEYARGVRDESGSATRAVGDYLRWAHEAGEGTVERTLSAAGRAASAVREDHATMRYYAAKYGKPGDAGTEADLPRDAVQKVGFQIMVAYRLMRFFVEAKVPLAPQVVSRGIRHLYGSDIHWEARFQPGVMIVHGMGMCISKYARVGRGVILFQHVTLGDGTHPETRKSGGPVIEDDVHVGAGSVILGPVIIGARSKVMATAVVRSSVPPDSLVTVPDAEVHLRVARRNGQPKEEEKGDGR